MLSIATLAGPWPRLGVVAAAALAAMAMLARTDERRAWAMLGALVLAPVLLLDDVWHSSQLHFVHRHPAEAIVGAVLILIVLAVAAVLIRRAPWLVGAAHRSDRALPGSDPVRQHHQQPAGAAVFRDRRLRAGLAGAGAVVVARRGAVSSRARGAVPAPRGAAAVREAAGRLHRALRAPGAVLPLSGFRQGGSERGLLLRPVRPAVRTSARSGVDPPAADPLPAGHRCAGGRLLADRLRRGGHQAPPAADRLEVGDPERAARVLHGQLGVPRPQHLRPLPRAGDDPSDRGSALRPAHAGATRLGGRARDPVGLPGVHAVALEPGRAGAWHGRAGGAALEDSPGPLPGGRRDRRRRDRGRRPTRTASASARQTAVSTAVRAVAAT